MILAKTEILKAIDSGELLIKSVIGFQPELQVSANSIDLSLGRYMFEVEKDNSVNLLTGSFEKEPILIDLDKYPNGYYIKNTHCYLAVTNEWLGSDTLLPKCADKSSMGRMFCPTHFNAGFFDVGFYGHTTLEIAPNLNSLVFKNILICQISLTRVDGKGDYSISGRYSNKFISADPYPIFSKGVKILKKNII